MTGPELGPGSSLSPRGTQEEGFTGVRDPAATWLTNSDLRTQFDHLQSGDGIAPYSPGLAEGWVGLLHVVCGSTSRRH